MVVEAKNQGIPEDSFYGYVDRSEDFCYVCNSEQDSHLMIVCDSCEVKVAHCGCAGFAGQDPTNL